MGKHAKGCVSLRKNVSLDTFLLLCQKTFDEFPSQRQWEGLLDFGEYNLFPTEKILEVLFFRYIKQFSNMLVNFIPENLYKSYNLVFNKALSDCYQYTDSSSDDFITRGYGIIDNGESLFYFQEYSSLGFGLADLTYPRFKYFETDGCYVCSADEDVEKFMEKLPSDETSKRKILEHFLPELMEEDPDLCYQSRIIGTICDAASYSSYYIDYTIYENRCLLAFHDWLEKSEGSGFDLSAVKPVMDVLSHCEKVLSNASMIYTITEFVHTNRAYYFNTMTGYDDQTGLCKDVKCFYPMTFFAMVAIDVILQYLNSRYHFYNDAERKEA